MQYHTVREGLVELSDRKIMGNRPLLLSGNG